MELTPPFKVKIGEGFYMEIIVYSLICMGYKQWLLECYNGRKRVL